MAGRLGIDFGTSNTVLTLWNESTRDSRSLQLNDFAHQQDVGGETIFIIPSVVHYAVDHTFLYGDQVLKQNLAYSPRTFQWMKRYISHRSPVERCFDGRRISYFDAGQQFLSEILNVAAEYVAEDEEVALTVPVESFEDYSNWIGSVLTKSNMFRFRIIDEPSAAALGYGEELTPDDVYLVFDFGGGTLDVSIVIIEEETPEAGRFCRVLGKSGIDLGGTVIDEWLFQEVLKQNGRSDSDEEVKSISRIILSECERLKEALSFNDKAEFSVLNPMTGAVIAAEFTRGQFEDLLDRHDAFALIDKTIRRALKAANERGFSEDNVKSVLMVGGCSQIPSIQKTLKRIFGNDRVSLKRPLDAVARGASVFVAGVAFRDFIQHDYVIRYVNPQTQGYEYRPLVRRGAPYPSTEPIAAITVKGAFDGQEQLGLPIFEIGSNAGSLGGEQRLELFFDEGGTPRVQMVSEREHSKRNYFWINENNPTFLRAKPPAQRGEARFRVEFSIDGNRRLLITAHDLKRSALMFKDYPVAKLT